MSSTSKKAENKLAWSSAFTLANTMMGCALLSLSYGFVQMGWIISTIIFLVCITFEYFAFRALIDCSYYGKHRTLRGMMEQVVGKVGAVLVDFCIAFSNIGFLTVYVSIFADYIQAFIVQVGGGEFPVRWIKLIVAPILFGVSLFKSADSISKASAFAILFIVVTVIAVIAFFFVFLARGTYKVNLEVGEAEIKFPGPQATLWPINSGAIGVLDVLKNIPLIMPLFSVQPVMSVLYYDLQGPPNFKRRVMHKANTISLIASGLMYLVVALLASWMFGPYIRDNILMSFLQTEVAMTVVRLLYAIVVILSYIVIIYPARAIIMEWCKLDLSTKKGNMVFSLIGLCIVIFTVGISIGVPSISKVINIVSSIFGTVVYWIIPVVAIWIVPRMHANTTTPAVDDVEDVEANAIQVRKRSMSTIMMEQQADKIKHFAKEITENRPRTRSEIMREDRKQRTRTGSQVSAERNEVVISSNASQSDEAVFKGLGKGKARSASVAGNNPTLANDLLNEENQNNKTDAQHFAEQAAQEVEEDPEIKVAIETIDVTEKKIEYTLSEEERKVVLAKMNKCRLAANWTTIAFFIALNLVGFILTFIDYQTLMKK